MIGRRILIFVVVCCLGSAAVTGALYRQGVFESKPPAAPNYNQASSWLCRPGRADACAAPTTATVFETETRKSSKTFTPDPAAPIDCFYVYPTVSLARGVSAPIAETEVETRVVREQFAAFTSVCRPFAPLYRQVTRGGLKRMFKGKAEAERHMAYADVLAAWKNYIARDNNGRGFVLIGHSQGARTLARLVKEEIDGKPIEAKMVSAIVVGTMVEVPEGKVVGGTYRHVPLCSSKAQTGCVIAYSTYPAARTMQDNSFFGAGKTQGMRFACVSPMALAGTNVLEADLPIQHEMRKKLGSDFSELPGLLAGHCKTEGRFTVFGVGATPGSDVAPKTEAMIARLADPIWGLHSFDINIALGTLIDIVRAQSAAYTARPSH